MNSQRPSAKAISQLNPVTNAGILLLARKSVFLNHNTTVQTAAPIDSNARNRCVPKTDVRVVEARVVEAWVVNMGSFGNANNTEKKDTTNARIITIMLIPNALIFPIDLSCKLTKTQNRKAN